MAEGAQLRFQAVPEQARLHHGLGLMTLIYHRRSGVTHMVMEPVPQILEALEVLGPSDAAAVTAYLTAHYDFGADGGADVADVIQARLNELAAIGLLSCETV